MRLRLLRPWGVAALYLLIHLGIGGITGCSSSQEDSEDVEATEQGGDENSEEGAEQGDQANGGNQEAENASEGEGNQGDTAQTENAGAQPAGGDQTEGDLQEIISEMNGNAAGGDAAAQAAPQGTNPSANASAANAAPAPAPADAAAGNASAAPASADAAAAAPAAAAGAPAGKGLPEMGSKMPYIVQQGDTLGKIAQKIYGNTAKWAEIKSLTGLTNPNLIFPGDVVYYQLTQESTAFATSYESQTLAETTVSGGQNLFQIAAKVKGNAKLWKEIWRYNDKVDNPDKLEAGMTIYYANSGAPAAQQNVESVNVAMSNVQVDQTDTTTDNLVDFVDIESDDFASADNFSSDNAFSFLVSLENFALNSLLG